MSVILAFFSGGILRMVSIAPALLEPAETYLRIVGGACFLNALIPIFSSYLRPVYCMSSPFDVDEIAPQFGMSREAFHK